MAHLAGLLQHQLAVDSTAFAQLPTILASLDATHLQASAHSAKWIARLNSLMHAKDPSFRWTGLCLAYKTCQLNLQLMLEHAETWIALVLPMLSRSEALPIHKICIHLLFYIFSAATHMTEFQRQVSSPNVPRFVPAIIAVAQKTQDEDLQAIVLSTLDNLIPIYPNLMRPIQAQIYKHSMQYLIGTFPSPTAPVLVTWAAKVQATLHLTGGKVGGAVAWRKTLDGALSTALSALDVLRSTFYTTQPAGQRAGGLGFPAFPEDPMLSMPLALARLHCMAILIEELLRTVTVRPVSCPVGTVFRLISSMMQSPPDPEQGGFVDLSLRSLQLTLSAKIAAWGCDLLVTLCHSVGRHLTPYVSQITGTIAHRLSLPDTPDTLRLALLRTVAPLLKETYPFHSTVVPSRLTKAILGFLTPLLPDAVLAKDSASKGDGGGSGGKGKGKKRARGYEGDELLKAGPQAAILDPLRSEHAEIAIEVLPLLLNSGFVSPAVHSLAHRVALSLLISLPQRTPQSLSPDLGFHSQILRKVASLSADLARKGNAGWAARSLGTVVSTIATIGDQTTSGEMELLLHPRQPPLLRSLPPMELITLYSGGESKEEKEAREALRLVAMDDIASAPTGQTVTTVAWSTPKDVVENSVTGSPTKEVATGQTDTVRMQVAAMALEPTKGPIISFASSTPAVPDKSSGPIEIEDSVQPATVYERPEWANDQPESVRAAPAGASQATPPKPMDHGSDDGDEEIPMIDMQSDSDDDES